jgi:HEPN domain-containing protein
MSSDLEDIITIISGRSSISNDLVPYRDKLSLNLKKIETRPDFEEAVYGHLPKYSHRNAESVLEVMREIC